MDCIAYEDLEIKIELQGPEGCFTDPSNLGERKSYPVPPPSAMNGAIRQVYGKPQMFYVVTRIAVCAPIVFDTVAGKELKSRLLPSKIKRWMSKGWEPHCPERTLRTSMILRNVKYIATVIPVSRESLDIRDAIKHRGILKRRLENGMCFSQPSFGMKEFVAHPSLPRPETQPLTMDMDFGLMKYGKVNMPDGKHQVVFFHAKMENGVINTDPFKVLDQSGIEEIFKCNLFFKSSQNKVATSI